MGVLWFPFHLLHRTRPDDGAVHQHCDEITRNHQGDGLYDRNEMNGVIPNLEDRSKFVSILMENRSEHELGTSRIRAQQEGALALHNGSGGMGGTDIVFSLYQDGSVWVGLVGRGVNWAADRELPHGSVVAGCRQAPRPGPRSPTRAKTGRPSSGSPGPRRSRIARD